MYKLRVAANIRGPALVIVPLSESLVDRAVFNGVVRVILGKSSVDTQEEFDHVMAIKNVSEDVIYDVLHYGPKVHVPPTDEECIAIEDFVATHLEKVVIDKGEQVVLQSHK